MTTITTRSGKGSPLTNSEVDANFTNLNTDKLELSGGTITGDLQAAGLYVGSSNTSYDFYNNGTSYLNGATTIDANTSINGTLTVGTSSTRNPIKIYSNSWPEVQLFKGTTEELRIGAADSSGTYNTAQGDFYIYDPTGNSMRLIVPIGASGSITRNSGAITVWDSSNDGSGSGLDADVLDGVQGSSYLRSDANDTYTGLLSLGNTSSRIDGSDGHPLVQVNSARAYFGSTSRSKTVLASSSNTGAKTVVSGTEYSIFHDNYHPNADKWTTARTLTLSGDASGSVSWDGSANATLSVTVANDSHSHKILKTSGNYVWSNSTTAGNYPTVDGVTGVQTSFVRTSDGWPNYGTVLHVGGRGGTDAGGDFQLYCGHGSANGGNYLRVRNADNSASPTDSWTSWRTIWDSGNDGSGSGLDADLLDGVQGSSFLRSDTDDTFTGDLTHVGGAVFGAGTLTADGQNDIYMFGTSPTGITAQGGNYHNKLRILGGAGQSRDLQLYQIDSEYSHIGSSWASNQLTIDSSFTQVNFNQSVRAPIFYDSNDTSYYVDPASTSDSALRVRGGALFGGNTTWGDFLMVGGDGRQNYINNTTTASVATTDGNLHLDAASGHDTYINYYDGINVYFGSGSNTQVGRITNAGVAQFNSFTDNNDTAYYVNPNSDSRISRLHVGDGSNYIRIGDEGEGANTSYSRIRTDSGGSLYIDAKGSSNIYLGWWSSPASRVFSEMGAQFPIYYDRNDTAYYTNPAGTSALYELTVGGGSPSRTFTVPNTGGTAQWVKLGNFAAGQDGRSVFINVVSNSGYNASDAQNSQVEIRFKTSNNSTSQSGFYGDVQAYKTGPNATPSAVRVVQQSTTSFDIWCSFGTFTGAGSFYTVYENSGTWTHSGTTSTSAPTGTYIDATLNTVWHSGNDGANSGLDADTLDGVHASNFVRKSGLGNSSYYTADNWLEFNASTTKGLFWSNFGNGWHIYPNDTQDMQLRSAASTNVGLQLSTQGTARGYVYANSANQVGFLDSNRNWSLKVDNSGNTFATASHRAPIFYDSDNTNYYLNPASSSVLHQTTTNWLGVGTTANSSGADRLTMGGNIDMNNYEINYLHQVHFNDGVRFLDEGNDNYLRFRWNDSVHGGIKFYDGNDLLHGFVYGDGYGGFGLLDKDGQWFIYTNGTDQTQIRANNNPELYIYTDHVYAPGSFRAPIFYDSSNTAYYVNPNGTSRLNAIDFGDSAPTLSQDGVYFRITTSDGYANLGAGNSSYFHFHTDRSTFYFNKTIEVDGGGIRMYDTNADVRSYVYYDQANTSYYFDGSATGDSIRVAGNIVAYYSDERLKDIEGNIDSPLEKVSQLNGFYYTANKKAQTLGYKDNRQVGVSAQEVEAVMPEIVTDAAIGHGYKTVDYAKLVPLLIEAVKEQQDQIETLKSRLEKLEN